MTEDTTFTISASMSSGNINIELSNINGNAPESITRLRLVKILGAAIAAVARSCEQDDMKDFELISAANIAMNETFADTELDLYKIPKSL